MRHRRLAAIALAIATAVALTVVATTSAARTAAANGKPIVIGAAIDLTKNMAPFDGPALEAAEIEIQKINAAGGVNGRPLQMKFINDQLDPNQTKADALKLVGEGVSIGWVTCDVDYATPAITEFLTAKLLTIAPCIGTDQMGPSRFGAAGALAYTFGNPAQQDGAAAAEWAYSHGWKTADVVTDKLLVYFQNVCTGFTDRFKQLGGKIVAQESFTQGDKTINNVATRVNGEKAAVIAFCTSFATDAPAFVDSLRTLGNKTPIIDGWASDGAYWWSKNPKITNFYFLTYASALTPDPDPAVNAFEAKMKAIGQPAQTGGFVTGADAIDAIVYAIKKAGGSTNGAKLAAVLSHLTKFQTLGGPISFGSATAPHSATGRPYRVIEVNNNKATFLGLHTTQKIPNIH
ncbi:MAG TPA: ABC transporter substrate-binding protein [Solirubrobacteraceae bacterium]|nr:ABC transporter substrate-binding protein [Solirubrobacteraceae bacterium]